MKSSVFKKTMSLFLSIVLLVSTFAIGVVPAGASMEKGEVWYAIHDKYELNKIRENPGANYYLADDIEFDERDYLNTGDFRYGFVPIENFQGKFDGRGHSIIDMKMNEYYTGIEFYCVMFANNYGVVENTIFKGLYYDKYNYIDGAEFVHANYGTIKNIHIENSKIDSVSKYNRANAVIEYCFIDENTPAQIAYENYGIIDGCISYAIIDEADKVNFNSGIVDSNNGLVSNCVFDGSITRASNLCGICRYNHNKIDSCVYSGNLVTVNGNYSAYGIAFMTGNGVHVSETCISNCLNKGYMKANSVYGIGNYAQYCVNAGTYTLVGNNNKVVGIGKENFDCYNINTFSSSSDSGKSCTAGQLADKSTYSKYIDFDNVWQIKDNQIGLQCENQKYIIITPYYFPQKTSYLINSDIDTIGLLLIKFDNLGGYEAMADDEYEIVGSTSKLGTSKVEIVSDFDTFYYYIDVYDLIENQIITLDTASYVYNGSAIAPIVTVKSQKGVPFIKNREYTISYANNIYPGKASVTVTGMGNYSGSVTKNFIILPAKVTGLSVSDRTSSSVTLTWTKQSGVTGYTVQKWNPSTSTWSVVKTITTNTNKATITGLSACKEYKFRVAAYKTVDGVKKYGSYSSYISKYTLPVTPSITSLKNRKIGFTVKWSKVSTATGYEVQCAKNKSFTSGKKSYTITKNSTVSKVVKALDASSTYYVRVRSYKTINGTKNYSKWSIVKSVKTPSAGISTPKVTSFKINVQSEKVTVKWTKVSGVNGYQVNFANVFYDWETDRRYINWRETRNVKGASKTTLTKFNNRDSFVRVRAYKVIDGRTYYGNWSKTKS